MTESLRYLIGNISRIMDYYISRHTDTNFDSIVCCGLGARVKGLMLLLTNELGQQVDVLQEFKNFACLLAAWRLGRGMEHTMQCQGPGQRQLLRFNAFAGAQGAVVAQK